MAKQETLITRKRRGPAPTGKGRLIGVRLQPDQIAALDRAISFQQEPEPTRPEMIRRMITDYLRQHGYLPKGNT